MKTHKTAYAYLLRFGELVGAITAVLLVFQIFFQDRVLTNVIERGSLHDLSFMGFNGRHFDLVYLNIGFDEPNWDQNVHVPPQNSGGTEYWYDTAWGAIALKDIDEFERSYITDLTIQFAEDKTGHIDGPVFVRITDDDGGLVAHLSAPPFSLELAEKTRCTRQVSELNGFRYAYWYVASCIWGVNRDLSDFG